MTDEAPLPAAVLAALLARMKEDRAGGGLQSVDAYQALYPGYEDGVAKKVLQIADGDTVGGDVAGGFLQVGATFGAYRIEAMLGQGGQGVVYKARDERLNRSVALKILDIRGPGLGDAFHRFQREAVVAARLQHPGICSVYESGIEDGMPFIAMQHVEGTTLSNAITSMRERSSGATDSFHTTFGEGEGDDGFEVFDDEAAADLDTSTDLVGPDRAKMDCVLRVVEQAARALHAAHEAGVVHRDIKPANVMVRDDGTPVILDFGLARDMLGEGVTLTRPGDLFGTLAYMSPEALLHELVTLDRRTDVWSLGVVLFEYLTYRRPFEAPTRQGLFQAIATREPPDPRKLNGAITRDLAVVIATALQKDRDRRYQTALDLAEELRRVREHEPILARPVGLMGRSVRWARRRPLAAALVLVLVAGIPLVAALSGYIIANQDDLQAQRQARKRAVVEALLERGYFALSFNQHTAEAIDNFESALAKDPTSLEAGAGLIFSLLDSGRPREAWEAVTRVAGQLREPALLSGVRADVLEALERSPEAVLARAGAPQSDRAVLWFLDGVRELSRGRRIGHDTKEGQAAFVRAEASLLRAVASTPRPRRGYYFQLAHAVGRRGRAGDPGMVSDVIEALWPDDARAWFFVGYANQDADPQRALGAYRESIRVNPGEASTRTNIGIVLNALECYEEAVAHYRESLELFPEYATTYNNLAISLGDLGKRDEAIAALREGLRIEPKNALLHYNLGVHLFEDGKEADAMDAFREAIRLRPNYVAACNNLGSLLQLRGESEEAEKWLRKAIAVNPAHADAYVGLSSALTSLGRYEESLEIMRAGLKLDPNNPMSYGNLEKAVLAWARELRADDELERAIKLLEEYSAAFPDNDKFLKAFKQLKRAP